MIDIEELKLKNLDSLVIMDQNGFPLSDARVYELISDAQLAKALWGVVKWLHETGAKGRALELGQYLTHNRLNYPWVDEENI